MKKILKITGIVALAITLVCNLEYALFSGDMKNTPNKAIAAWSEGYPYLTYYCGPDSNRTRFRGTWSLIPGSPFSANYGTDAYVALFTMNSNGYNCAPNEGGWCCSTNQAGYYYPNYYITATTGQTYWGTVY
jgi:hypothetical protein